MTPIPLLRDPEAEARRAAIWREKVARAEELAADSGRCGLCGCLSPQPVCRRCFAPPAPILAADRRWNGRPLAAELRRRQRRATRAT